jgi:hypothetical protein
MGSIFIAYIGCRVVTVCQRPSLAHHPCVQILTRSRTDSHDAAVLVGVVWDAVNRLVANLIGQGKGCLLAASVLITACLAKLVVFWCVDAEQADALPVNRAYAGQLTKGRQAFSQSGCES